MLNLHDYHKQHALGFVQRGTLAFPLRYREHQTEYAAAKTAAMFDGSAFGKLHVLGKDREALLHRLTTNEMRNLPLGATRVNVFTNAKGRVVDRVEMLAQAERYLLLTSPGYGEILRAWIDKYVFIEDVKVREVTNELSLIALFGMESAARLQKELGLVLEELPAGRFSAHSWNGQELLVHRPEAASAARFNLLISAEAVSDLWQVLLPSFTPIGFAAFETLRIMQGIPMAPHELSEEYNPHEIGLYSLINFEKGCYIGQEVVARLDTYQKVQRRLVGIKLDIEPNDLGGATLFAEQQEIGKLTSIAHAPSGHGAIGLALVRKQYADAETQVEVRAPNGELKSARLTALPFKIE